MPSLHATLSPGVVTSLDEVITLTFDDLPETSPDEIDVQLMEADDWTSVDGQKVNQGTEDDLVFHFVGKVQKREFLETKVFALPPGPKDDEGKPILRPLMKFQINPSNTFIPQIPVSGLLGERETGYMQLYVKVSGKLNGVEATPEVSTPIQVRTQPTKRPRVSFITGKDSNKTNKFFKAAEEFWKLYSDGVDKTTTLRGILDYLVTNKPPKSPWGEVNIVAHGNAFLWFIARDDAELAKAKKEGHSPANGSEELEEWIKGGGLPTLGPDVLDKDSLVVLRGCNLGKNPRLLAAVKKIFGGACIVAAPQFLQFYEYRTTTAKKVTTKKSSEAFWEQRFYYLKGTKADDAATAKKRIEGSTNATNLDSKHYQTHTYTFPYTVTYAGAPGKAPPTPTKSEVLADVRSNWKVTDMNERTSFDDWDWVVTVGPGKGVARGSRVRCEFRRAYTGKPDGSGDPAIPSVPNPTHYGTTG